MNRKRIVLLSLCSVGYLLALFLFFRPVQIRIWNYFNVVDVFTMACLILPFMVIRLRVQPLHRVTRYAWLACAVMALDLMFFAMAEFGPLTTGHPSLESLASFYLAMAKVVLVPVALLLLSIACLKGEQVVIVATGFLCLVGETLYATYPTSWWGSA